MAGTVGTAYVDVELDPTGIRRGLTKVEHDAKQGFDRVGKTSEDQMKAAGDKAGSGFRQGFGKSISGIGAVAKKGLIPATAALGALAIFGKKAIDAASDLNEQVNKTGVVFKSSSKDILEWSKGSAKALGMSRREALEATGTFGNMLVPMGVARKEAAGMSKRFVQLGADLASFNNADPSDTLDAIRSGLAGETEPLRKFGVFLNQARIAQEAVNMGLVTGAAAYKASQQAVRDATKGVADAQRERTAAAAAVESANKRLVTADKAIQTSADAVRASQERVRDATSHLSDAENTATTASQRLRDAKHALTAAQQQARATQVALTEARKQATQQLLDLRDASADAALGEERAGIALERARASLDKTQQDSEATDLDKRDALLSVREAERSLAEAQQRREKSAADLADADQRGIEGSQVVLDAKQNIAEADQRTIKAARAVAAAQRGLASAQDKVRDAIRGVAAAQDDLQKKQGAAREATVAYRQAQQDLRAAQVRSVQATKGVATAEGNLVAAKRNLTKASKSTVNSLTAEQKALATSAIIWKDTHDAHGDFVKTSKGVANQQRIIKATTEDTAAAIGKGLLPAQQKMNEAMLVFLDFATKHPKAVTALAAAFATLATAIYAIVVATKIWTAVNWLLDASLAPWLLIPIAIAAIVAGLVILYLKSDKARKVMDAMFGAIVDGAKWVLDFFKANWQYVIAGLIFGPFGIAVVAIIKHWDDIKQAVSDGVHAVLGFLSGILSKVEHAATAIGDGIKDGVVGTVTGVASAVWNTLLRIGELIARKLGEVAGWGASLGDRIKDSIVGALVGVATGVWGIVARIPGFFRDNVATIVQWGTDIGGWLRNAIIDGLTGLAVGVWGWLDKAWQFIKNNADTIKGWGQQIGNWLRDAIVDGLKGLGKLIRDAVRKALGKLGKVGSAVQSGLGLIPHGVGVAGVGVGPQAAAVQAGLLGAGGAAGGVAGPAPPLYQFRQALADLQRAQPQPEQNLMVRVFIGDQELRGIVRTEAVRIDNATARMLLAGAGGAVA